MSTNRFANTQHIQGGLCCTDKFTITNLPCVGVINGGIKSIDFYKIGDHSETMGGTTKVTLYLKRRNKLYFRSADGETFALVFPMENPIPSMKYGQAFDLKIN